MQIIDFRAFAIATLPPPADRLGQALFGAIRFAAPDALGPSGPLAGVSSSAVKIKTARKLDRLATLEVGEKKASSVNV